MKKNKDTSLSIGVDIGGTKILTALINSGGEVMFSTKNATDPSRPINKIIDDIVRAVEYVQEKVKQSASYIGVGFAGQVDANGVVHRAPNLGWKDVDLKTLLEKKTDLPVHITNDVRAATWGEWKFGAGKGYEDIVVVFIGTGIGGGIVSDGKLLLGHTGTGGEIGHITLVEDGRKCRCPNYGCIEAYAGGWAIAERAQVALENFKGDSLITSNGRSVQGITAADVTHAFRQGDLLAEKLVLETGRLLGSGLIGIVNSFNPKVLILGGGVIENLPELIPIAEERLRKFALRPGIDALELCRAALGGTAGAIGAADMAREVLSRG